MVSVIICTYNYGRFLGEAIRSVLEQSDPDVECVVIDNGSTDNTEQVARSFNDSRVIYHKQHHTGVSAGRNKGIMLSKGDLLCFLDADDLIEREKLPAASRFLRENREVDLVYSDMRYFRDPDQEQLYNSYACKPGDRPWMKYVSGSGKEIVASLLGGNIMVICSPVVRRSALEEAGFFDESLEVNEDWDLWLRFALSGKRIHYLDERDTLALVRVHKTSLSRDVFRMQVCGLRVLMKNAAAIRSFGLDRQLEARQTAHLGAIVSTLSHTGKEEFETRRSYLRQHGLEPLVRNAPFSLNKLVLLWRLTKAGK